MIHITEITKSFGTQVILDQASLHIRPGMRIGLVGPNGAGKTTLLRILAGEMSLDDGEINARKGLRIGFLPQEIEEIADHAVLDEVLTSYADILDMEHRLKDLGDRIGAAYTGGSAEDADALMHELGTLQTAFEHANGYELESRAQSILRGMGFRDDDFLRPIASSPADGGCGWRWPAFSWRQPDLLLLDEPTNHLDLESLLWLEEFLLEWPGALVIVSHDRYFLNRMVTHIAELDRGVMDLYAGDYDHFEVEKQQRYEALANAAKNQQREIDVGGELRAPLPGQEHQGQAGAAEDPAARQDGAHRRAQPGAQEDQIPLPAAGTHRPRGRGTEARAQSIRRHGRLQEARPGRRAGAEDRARRAERRRQVYAAQAAGRGHRRPTEGR